MKILSVLLAFALVTNSAIAQNGKAGQYRATRNYDPSSTVTTIEGSIMSVEQQTPGGRQEASGVHLIAKTSSGEITVHVGPKWYLDQQSVSFKKGERISVEGSKRKLNGKQVIIARKITKGTEITELRGQDGTPVWSGRNNR